MRSTQALIVFIILIAGCEWPQPTNDAISSEPVVSTLDSAAIASLLAQGEQLEKDGAYEAALELYSRGLKQVSDDQPLAADLYYAAGTLHKYFANLERTKNLLSQALVLFKAKQQMSSVGSTLEGLCATFFLLRDFDTATAYCSLGLEVAKGLASPASEKLQVNLYTTIGEKLLRQHKFDVADEALDHALFLFHQAYTEDNSILASVYRLKGTIHRFSKNYHQSLEARREVFRLYDKAIHIETQIKRPDHPAVGNLWSQVAEIYNDLGQYEQALEAINKALSAYLPAFSLTSAFDIPKLDIIDFNSPQLLIEAIKNKAIILTEYYQVDPANRIEALLKANDAFMLLGNVLIPQMRKQKEDIGAWWFNLYTEYAVRTAYLLFEHTNEERYVEDALVYIARNKAYRLRETIQHEEALAHASVPEDILEQEARLREQVWRHEERLSHANNASLDSLIQWRAAYARERQAHAQFVSQIEAAYPAYKSEKILPPSPSLQATREYLLNNHTAVLSWFASYFSAYAVVVTAERAIIQPVEAFDYTHHPYVLDRFSTQVDQFREAIEQDDYGAFVAHGHGLYADLIAPVESHLDRISHVMLIPDRGLHHLPFDALLTPRDTPSTTRDYSTLPYLLHRYQISTYPSVDLLLAQHERKLEPTRDFLAVAPVFKDGLQATTRAGSYYNEQQGERAYRMGALPYSEAEVETVKALFDQQQQPWKRWLSRRTRAYLHNAARERTLKNTDLQAYRVLHFATHAIADEEEPLRSALLLTEEADRAEEDGILHLSEIYSLDLAADLVVLSACDTGRGQVQTGEGSVGLGYGFLQAGAKNVLMSLNRVQDLATKDLMVDFYRYVLDEGASYTAALHHAKTNRLQRPATRPKDWAWFVLMGR